jgi:hypothetical protein
MGGCRFGINTVKKFEDGVTVPGLSLKGAAYLIGKKGSFGHTVTPKWP